MSNEFQEIFNTQTEFLRKVLKQKHNVDLDTISKEDRIHWTKEMILSSSKEIHELLDILQWKTHRYESNAEMNLDNFTEQAIDAFKYLLNVCLLNGIDAEQFLTKYQEKSKIVDIRFNQEKKLYESQHDKSEKYVVFDIDGVINDYPLNVMQYMNVEDLNNFKKTNRSEYRKLKDKFETTGEERNNTVNPMTREVLKHLSESFKIILLTARPYEKISRLYYDTIFWLEKEQIPHDYLFFSEQKEDFLLANFNPEQIEFVVDDQIDNINKLSNTFKTFLLYNKNLYNSEDLLGVKKNVTVIENIRDLPCLIYGK
jgi:uncharacterized protein YktA (UPF0223 family)